MITTARTVFAEPGRDPMQQFAELIESIVDRDGWDQPDRLFLLESTVIGGQVGAYKVREMPMLLGPPYIHPARVLGALSEIVAKDPMPPPFLNRQFAGLAIAVESYLLTANTLDGERLQSAIEAAARREVYKHPDRVECRLVVMFVLPESTVVVLRQRGRDDVVDFGHAVAVLEGIPEALRSTAKVLADKAGV